MTKELFLQNISTILAYYKLKQASLRKLSVGVQKEGEERNILEAFLDTLCLEKNEKTYYAAYMRLAMLKEEALILYLETFSDEEKNNVLQKAYIYVVNYHTQTQDEITDYIKQNKLLSDFYLALWESMQDIGISFNKWFPDWKEKIIHQANGSLEQAFDGDGGRIMKYLEESNLFDTGYFGKKADRCYSVLIKQSPKSIAQVGIEWQSVSYREAFPEVMGEIIEKLEKSIEKLSHLEDEIYHQKAACIEYFRALRNAFSETDTSRLVSCWGEVDKAWMGITGPLQPSHPLEYYEDSYRNAVAPEWDLRIVDESILQSQVSVDIFRMYESLFIEKERETYKESYDFSLASMRRVQLYISTPVLYYGSELAGLFSAQVVPNDKVVSDGFGKKIFAFPEFVLMGKRSQPHMKINEFIFEKSFLDAYYSLLNGDEKIFYQVYDIETIGHEYGHTLGLYKDSEEMMNVTGNFSNIEEWKATAGGLIAYFLSGKTELQSEILLDHIFRSVGLMKYREVDNIIPYYCEGIIHLTLLFKSSVLAYKNEKLVFQNTHKNYEVLKSMYLETYKKERKIYLEKRDAGEFLFDYVVRESGVFLPKDFEVRNFVKTYYHLYKSIGNEIS